MSISTPEDCRSSNDIESLQHRRDEQICVSETRRTSTNAATDGVVQFFRTRRNLRIIVNLIDLSDAESRNKSGF